MKDGIIRGVLFDFDGTITVPGSLDFRRLREELGCAEGYSILDFLSESPNEAESRRRREVLTRYEDEAADRAREHPGAAQLVRFLRERNLAAGIITRNSKRSIERSFRCFRDLSPADFDIVVTRDDGPAAKPSPEGVEHAARSMGIPPSELLVIGDYIYDVEAGRRAGSVTVFLDNLPSRTFADPGADYTIRDLGELREVVELHLPLPRGKLPNRLLASFLGETAAEPSLLVPPGVGEDAAAVEHDDGSLLLLKSDPVTFLSANAGRYAIAVNANDIAAAGGTPKWLLATLLFPPGSTPAGISEVFDELRERCRETELVLAGGHTEITGAVTRPVVSLAMAGTVSRERLLRKSDIREGDILLLTKRIAVEGTAILAAELVQRLREAGLEEEELRIAASFADRISILPEAYAVRDAGAAVAMHDVTEGGLATALRELSEASGRRLRIMLDRIPVYPETSRICRALGLDPLGLIGSGSLVIACRPDRADAAERAVGNAGVETTRIGVALGEGTGIEAMRGGTPAVFPEFPADEIARVL